ncbi:MAG: MFS transporter [Deltaproteobacteria bacterium]|nr:MFS transporter [Deltaproteobacteria bacterium]
MTIDKEGRKNILGLGLISLMNDMSSEMIYPLLPVFLTSVLHAGAASLGIIEGVAETTVSVLKYFSGYVSDRTGKRKAIFAAGYTVSNVIRPLIGVATMWWHVLIFRFGDRVGKGIRTAPRDALLSESASDADRGLAFGFQRAMDHMGAIIGPLIAASLIRFCNYSLKTVFLLSAIPGVITVMIAFFAVKEKTPRKSHRIEVNNAHKSFMRPAYLFFLVTILVFTLGNSTDAFLLLRAKNLGVTLGMIPILWVVFHISKTLFSVPGGRLSDILGRKAIIIAGWVVYSLVYLGFAFAASEVSVWILFVIYGVYFGLCEGTEKAFVADLVPDEGSRGNAYGLYNLAIGIGAFPASVVFGVVWDVFGPHWAFIMGSALALIASVMLTLLKVR